jgi:Zinc-binding domain of primase-helicase
MTLPDHLAALRDEALQTSCESWAKGQGWKLSPGLDRAGPCPVCGGTDRFSIHTRKNLYSCRQCGLAGEGVIKLVMETQGVGFTEACEIITGRKADAPFDPEKAAEIRRRNEAAEAQRAADADRYRQKARREGYEIWKARSRDPGRPLVAEYLIARGLLTAALIECFPEILLGQHDRLPYMDRTMAGAWVQIAMAPAMLAPIQMADGRFGAVHRTWLDPADEKGRLRLVHPDTGKELETKKTWGIKQGGAIRLFTPPAPARIVMGEGIETTLTALAHNFEPQTAYWAGVDIGNMSGRARRDGDGKLRPDLPDLDDLDCWQPPGWCAELIYLGETEKAERNTNQKLIRGLLRAQIMRRRARESEPGLPDLETAYIEPPEGGGDLNDLVRVKE